MKKNTSKLAFFVFLFVLIAGIVLLAIPFDYEKFYYNDVTFKTTGNGITSGFNGSFSIINCADEDFEDVTIEFDYEVEHNFNDVYHSMKIENFKLEKGSNTINFTHTENDYSIYILDDISNVKITLSNGKTIEIGKDIFFTGSNWYFLGMIIIGFICSFIAFIFWKIAPKTKSRLESISKGFRNFEERVKEAFSPVVEEKEEKENKKFVCKYCKVQYDSSLDKCPHCGAPPERKD